MVSPGWPGSKICIRKSFLGVCSFTNLVSLQRAFSHKISICPLYGHLLSITCTQENVCECGFSCRFQSLQLVSLAASATSCTCQRHMSPRREIGWACYDVTRRLVVIGRNALTSHSCLRVIGQRGKNWFDLNVTALIKD